MYRLNQVWKYSPLSRDTTEHENFAREVLKILFDVLKKSYRIKLQCNGFHPVPGEPIIHVSAINAKRTKYLIEFIYVDCLDLMSYDVLMNRVGKFLTYNGYAFNPITNAIIFILHEVGHIVHSETMARNSLMDLSDFVDANHRKLIDTVVGENEVGMHLRGDPIRYMLSGAEMFCDGFAMTYFRAVANALIEKGLPEDILTRGFSLDDCYMVYEEGSDFIV